MGVKEILILLVVAAGGYYLGKSGALSGIIPGA
jgi:hypothetical protein